MPDPHNGQSASSIRAVILDYGDVISQSPDSASISAMADVFEVPVDRFLNLYAATRHEYDRGDVDAEKYWARIAQAAGAELSPYQLTHLRQTDITMWSNVRPEMLRWAEKLRAAGFKTAMLSNMHDDMVQHLRSDSAWATRFNCLTLSSAIGMAKPEPQIFQHCLECLQVAPDEALFVDDRTSNVEAAQALGIKGVVANSLAELRKQLDAIGFAPLPE